MRNDKKSVLKDHIWIKFIFIWPTFALWLNWTHTQIHTHLQSDCALQFIHKHSVCGRFVKDFPFCFRQNGMNENGKRIPYKMDTRTFLFEISVHCLQCACTLYKQTFETVFFLTMIINGTYVRLVFVRVCPSTFFLVQIKFSSHFAFNHPYMYTHQTKY